MADPRTASITASPMHARDRVFYVILTWSTIPAALVVGSFIAWASGQISTGWAVAGCATGLLGMAAATIYALEKRPPSPRYPGPIVIAIAALTWALIGWQTWIWLHPPVQPVQGYTQAQLDDAIAKAKDAATKPLKDQLDQTNKDAETLRQNATRQIADTVAKATAQLQVQIAQLQSDTPVSVEKLPTTLRLLFKGNDIEEIEAQNVVWAKLVALQQKNYSTLFFGQQTTSFPVWAIILVFKKPIAYKEIHIDDHGVGLPAPDIGSNSRFAVITFNSGPQDGLVDITPTNEHRK